MKCFIMRLLTKIFFTCSILTFIGFTPLKAQNFEGYLIGGGTASHLLGDNLSDYTKLGFFGGPSVAYPFNDRFALGIQLFWFQKGSRRDAQERQTNRGNWETMHLDYIDIPVFLEFQLNDKIRFHGGFSGSYLINASENGNDENIADSFRRPDLLNFLGGSYRFTDRMHFFLRYSYSLFSINKDSQFQSAIFSQRQRGIFNHSISFGIQYDLNKQ